MMIRNGLNGWNRHALSWATLTKEEEQVTAGCNLTSKTITSCISLVEINLTPDRHD